MGAGAFGRHHASKYAQTPGLVLTAVSDLLPDIRARASAELDVASFANWRDLIGKVDLVSVCSPASTHAEIVRGFLTAGVHVLVEKPIATDLDEADELIAIARKKKLVLTVGHQERFVFAKSGLLDYPDAPLALESVRTGPWTGRGGDVSVVLDLMIHDLDLVHCLIPHEVVDVQAFGRSIHGKFRDEVGAVVRFANGSECKLLASRIADSRRRSLRAVYPDGTIAIDFLSRKTFNTTRRDLKPLDLTDPLAESLNSFVTAVKNGGSALVLPAQARRALETALMVEEAAAPMFEGMPFEAVALTA